MRYYLREAIKVRIIILPDKIEKDGKITHNGGNVKQIYKGFLRFNKIWQMIYKKFFVPKKL